MECEEIDRGGIWSRLERHNNIFLRIEEYESGGGENKIYKKLVQEKRRQGKTIEKIQKIQETVKTEEDNQRRMQKKRRLRKQTRGNEKR